MNLSRILVQLTITCNHNSDDNVQGDLRPHNFRSPFALKSSLKAVLYNFEYVLTYALFKLFKICQSFNAVLCKQDEFQH